MSRTGRPWRPRRILGAFRTGDDRPLPSQELQRLVLYLTVEELEEAQRQAIRTGHGTPQRYAEEIVRREVEANRVAFELAQAEQRHGRLEGLHAVAEDPDYLAEWTASRAVEAATPTPRASASLTVIEPAPESVIRRHAGLEGGEEASCLLPALRAGRWIGEEAAGELLVALRELEEALSGQTMIGRSVSYALHRLAFEGQILASEPWAAGSLDGAAVGTLRRIQEGVDRVLSGQDIRYDLS